MTAMMLRILLMVITGAASTSWAGTAKVHDRENLKEGPPIALGQGEQRLLWIPGLIRFSLGSAIVRARPIPHSFSKSPKNARDRLLIKGIHPGRTDLWVWKKDGVSEHRTIHVEKVLGTEIDSQLERALGRLEEAEVIYAGAGVILRGPIQSLPECARIAALVRGFPQKIYDETVPSEALLAEGLIRLQAWITRSAFSSRLRVERFGNTLWVRGNLDHPTDGRLAVREAQSLFPKVQTEIQSMPDSAPTVHFRVFLLELKRSRFGSLGLTWPGSQEAAFRVTTNGIQDMLQLDLTLQALEGEGSAKILSNPELVVRAPGEAELFSGGELPLHVESHFYSNVSWKNYGLTLRLKVTHSTGERVRLDIFTEVSHLDPNTTLDKIPGIQTNRMRTQVDARYGVPLLLSGLLQQGTREQARGLPFLRRIPVLGLLFGSEDYLNERSELVAVLLPNTAPPPAPMNRFGALLPSGPIPPPRHWMSPAEERRLRQSPDFPWNALE